MFLGESNQTVPCNVLTHIPHIKEPSLLTANPVMLQELEFPEALNVGKYFQDSKDHLPMELNDD